MTTEDFDAQFADRLRIVDSARIMVGPETGGAMCVICGERLARWEIDARGVLVWHERRVFPCRIALRRHR